MIHYALRCASGHDFDGWFRGVAAFETQAGAGLLQCPLCASCQVSRALMAPNLSFGARAPAVVAPAPARPDAPAAESQSREIQARETRSGPAPGLPDQTRAVLQRLRAEVERRCDYVGPAFAHTARAMHDGIQPPRPIYGEATPDEADALTEDGIEVSSLPWLPRADS